MRVPGNVVSIIRRALQVIFVGAGTMSAAVVHAQGLSTSAAQAYPGKTLRIITSEAGGSTDITARIIALGLAPALGQSVIVENRAGIVSGQIVAQAQPDGYTLLLAGGSFWVAPLLRKSTYDPVRDFSPITFLVNSPQILVVNPASAVKTVKDLIDMAKARPGELNYSSSSVGGATHLAGELFKSMAGVDIVHIPYKGSGAALTDLMAGHIHLAFPPVASVTSHIRSGRLRAIAVTSIQPSAVVPGLPTVAQTLSGYSAGGATSIYAPRGLPAAILGRLNRDIVSLLNKPDTKEKFLGIGIDTVGSSPEELAATMRSELARVGKLIKESGFRLD